jgi:hypothetical protein
MERSKKAVNGIDAIRKFIESRGYMKASRQQSFDINGNVAADFQVHVKGQLEIITNSIEGVVGINMGGKPLLGFSKTMSEHLDTFKAYLSEMEKIFVQPGK